jgi:hypothetical protein
VSRRPGPLVGVAVAVIFVAMIVLHQDTWNWKDATLVFGFLPMGLAYHAGYSLLSALVLAGLVRFAWPAHLEDAVPVADSPVAPPAEPAP